MKKINYLVALVLAILLATSVAMAEDFNFSGLPDSYRYLILGDAYVTPYEHVDVYAKGDRSSELIGQLAAGSTVEVLSSTDQYGWVYVRSAAIPQGGWVAAYKLCMKSWTEYNGYLASSGEGRRINLRQAPSSKAYVEAKYYSGTLVQILEEEPYYEGSTAYYHVRIGESEGYVDGARLKEGISTSRYQQPSVMVYSKYSTQHALYRTPDDREDVVCYVTNASYVTVLGIRRDGLYHVMYEGYEGYIDEYVMFEKLPWDLPVADTETGPTPILLKAKSNSMFVLSASKDSRVNLRRRANAESIWLVQYYTGTPAVVLGEEENGYIPVRIGRVEGYMDKRFLAATPYDRTSDLKLYEVASINGNVDVLQWNAVGSEVIWNLKNGERVVVIGRDGDWAHIVWDKEEQNYGFVYFADLVEVIRQ